MKLFCGSLRHIAPNVVLICNVILISNSNVKINFWGKKKQSLALPVCQNCMVDCREAAVVRLVHVVKVGSMVLALAGFQQHVHRRISAHCGCQMKRWISPERHVGNNIIRMKNIEILGVVIFKRLFFGNQRVEKKSITGRIFVLYIIKHRQCSYSLLLSKIINLICVS